MKAAERIKSNMGLAAVLLDTQSDEPAELAYALGQAGQLIAEAISEGGGAFVGFLEGVKGAAESMARLDAEIRAAA